MNLMRFPSTSPSWSLSGAEESLNEGETSPSLPFLSPDVFLRRFRGRPWGMIEFRQRFFPASIFVGPEFALWQ
jgi:hypothetical protein